MEQHRFDELTRAMAEKTTRGGFFRMVFGAASAAVLTTTAAAEAQADDLCKPQGKKCNKPEQCCAPGVDNAHATCEPGTGPKGKHGVCGTECDEGYTQCGDTCIPVDACCGGCGAGQVCENGTCVDQVCTPQGGPCNLNNPGACCSRACLSTSGGLEGTCL